MNTVNAVLYFIQQFWFEMGFGAMIIAAAKFLFTEFKKQNENNDTLKIAIQAMLRNDLLHNYHEYIHKGYCSTEEKENWINMYNQYHTLGANGVMDEKKKKLLALPDEIV